MLPAGCTLQSTAIHSLSAQRWHLSIIVTMFLQIVTRAVTGRNSHQQLRLGLVTDNFQHIPVAFIVFKVFKVDMLKFSATLKSRFACAVPGAGHKSGIISGQGLPS